jgi:RNA polymerase sigma-70 factor (ECF subfamily)
VIAIEENLIRAKIERLAFLLLGNYHDAWDLAQEVFLELEKGRQKWELAECKLAWAMGVFHRQFKRFLRLKGNHKITSLEEEVCVAAKNISPEYQAMLQEEVEKTFTILQTLNKDAVEALLLFSVEKIPIKEIAALQKVPEGTVKWRIFEARRKLALAIGKKDATKE